MVVRFVAPSSRQSADDDQHDHVLACSAGRAADAVAVDDVSASGPDEFHDMAAFHFATHRP